MINSYSNLDLDIIKKKVSDFTPISEAKSFIMDESVSFNPLQIRKNVSETKEALSLLKDNNDVSFDGIYNVVPILEKADKNIMLSGQELRKLLVFHNHSYRIKKQFDKFDDSLSIRDYTDAINIHTDVFERIERCIENSGEVKDDASDRLRSLSAELNQCEKDLYNKAHTFIDRHMDSLQEPSVFIRNERVTFLIKNSDKNKYQGYTYGSSASGLAFYVEPATFIEANNRKLALQQEREDEIVRILQELSYLISSVSDEYKLNFDSLIRLSVIFAKAKYGYDTNGIMASLNNDLTFCFTDLCHPLIDSKKVVSNTYRLYEPYLGIVISGSNTGGKTVSLKAIGLSILMTYLGIPVIASEASVPIYHNIFVDIDDNQSIADSLSTFSAHISNINSILKHADSESLILIDELISGTDPKEAQAISLAILDKIKQLRARFIITTHFDDIKKYSYDDKEILLSSVSFDMDTLTPTYHYLEDSIGSSNAIEIASRYLDDEKLIENARRYLNDKQSKEEELLDKLSKQIEETEKEKQQYNELKAVLAEKEKEYSTKLADFDNEKEKLKAKYLEDMNTYVEGIKEEALALLESIKDKKDEQVISKIEELKSEKETEKEEEHVFAVGDNVRIGDNEQIGEIVAISNNTASVNLRGLTVKTDLKDLKLMPKIKKKQVRVISDTYKRVPGEINLVGNRVEDGLIMMEEYLDKANAAHMSSVKVIHGIGTGTLRKALRQRLAKLSYVKSFNDGDYYDGGSAVTIVVFK